MRKITSEKDLEKKRKRNQLIVGLVLIGVMVFGTLGYAFQGNEKESDTNKISYNGFEFVNQNNFWVTKIGESEFIFKYNPNQVDKIEGKFETIDNYYQKPLYIYSENDEASLEIIRNTNSVVQRIQKACFEEKDCNNNLPLKTCEDNLIIIKLGTTSKIEQKNNCVFIEGSKEELTKLSDGFLFKILGIN